FGQTMSIAPAMLCWNGVNPGWRASSPAERGTARPTISNTRATDATDCQVWILKEAPPASATPAGSYHAGALTLLEVERYCTTHDDTPRAGPPLAHRRRNVRSPAT